MPPNKRRPWRGAVPQPSLPQTVTPACGAATASRLGSIRRLQPEPHAADRLDQLVAERLPQFAPQVADMHVDHVALGVEMHVPDFFQQLGATDDLFGVQQEVLQSMEL